MTALGGNHMKKELIKKYKIKYVLFITVSMSFSLLTACKDIDTKTVQEAISWRGGNSQVIEMKRDAGGGDLSSLPEIIPGISPGAIDVVIPEVLLEKVNEENEVKAPHEDKKASTPTVTPTPVPTKDPSPAKDEKPAKEPTPTPKPKEVKKPTPTQKLVSNSTLKPEVNKDTRDYAKSILKTITSKGMSDVERLKAVHDYIVINTAYDYDNFKKGTIPVESFTIEGVLNKGVAVCQGYAYAFQLFMELLNIESKIVVGTADNVSHAWNMVSLDSKWYHVDVTWNDPVPDMEGRIQYNYFLVTDAIMEPTHIWKRGNYPVCNSEDYQYYVFQQYIVDSIEKYEEKFLEQYNAGETTITVLYPEDGKPKLDFLWEYVLEISYYRPWRHGNYTVFTVVLNKEI